MAQQSLFRDIDPFAGMNRNRPSQLGKGSLVSFRYPMSQAARPNVIHDSNPLVIVTDVTQTYLRGVNLHYLTFPYIRSILQGNAGNTGYSYFQVKADRYIAQAFRMYFRSGVSQVRMMDADVLVKILGGMRSWSEAEIEVAKQQVRQQIRQRLQVRADELTRMSQQAVAPGPPSMNGEVPV